MTTFTLRLDPVLAKKLDQLCREKGYKKTGLIQSLIRDFLKEKEGKRPLSSAKQRKRYNNLVGIFSLGGDAVEDAERYYE